MPTCYRHPTRETGVACSSCGRPICPDCMTSTPVGMRCPDCARQRTRVTRVRPGDMPAAIATQVIIGLNVVAYLAQLLTGGGGFSGTSGTVYEHGALFGPTISIGHDYWRLATSGFLHASFFHIAVNMYVIWIVGRSLEPAIGTARFVALYVTALLCGSFGVLLLEPSSVAIGASGAAFGLFGAMIVEARRRGIDLWQSGLIPIMLINFAFTFLYPGIAIGAHVFGFAGGLLVGVVFDQADRRRLPRSVSLLACAAIALAAVVGGIAVA
jgi:membrane associated rhomboid family serine protease